MKPAIVNTRSETELEVVRRFDAPVEQIWEFFSEGDRLRQWMLGPPGWSMPVCEMDFRVGGQYENVFRNDEDGLEIVIAGEFRVIEKHREIVQDERHVIGHLGEGKSQETVVTISFQEAEGMAAVTTLIEYTTKAARDAALATDMGVAMEMGYCRIDELLKD